MLRILPRPGTAGAGIPVPAAGPDAGGVRARDGASAGSARCYLLVNRMTGPVPLLRVKAVIAPSSPMTNWVRL